MDRLRFENILADRLELEVYSLYIFILDWRKKDMNILDEIGVSKLSEFFYSGSELIL